MWNDFNQIKIVKKIKLNFFLIQFENYLIKDINIDRVADLYGVVWLYLDLKLFDFIVV